MKIQQLLHESVDAEEVKKWMGKYGIRNYELHEDGSVTINGAGFPEVALGNPRFPIPFSAIRAINGSMSFGCYSNTSSRLDKFIQRANFGNITIKLYNPGPVLSFTKIKGNSRIRVQISGRRTDGTTGRLTELESLLSQNIQDARDGILDIFDMQEELIDAGYKEYAKI